MIETYILSVMSTDTPTLQNNQSETVPAHSDTQCQSKIQNDVLENVSAENEADEIAQDRIIGFFIHTHQKFSEFIKRVKSFGAHHNIKQHFRSLCRYLFAWICLSISVVLRCADRIIESVESHLYLTFSNKTDKVRRFVTKCVCTPIPFINLNTIDFYHRVKRLCAAILVRGERYMIRRVDKDKAQYLSDTFVDLRDRYVPIRVLRNIYFTEFHEALMCSFNAYVRVPCTK